MKEASGELSMTAIAVVAIAALGLVFTTLIYPRLKSGIVAQTNCSQAFNCHDCDDGGMCTCSYCEDDACAATAVVRCNKNDTAGA